MRAKKCYKFYSVGNYFFHTWYGGSLIPWKTMFKIKYYNIIISILIYLYYLLFFLLNISFIWLTLKQKSIFEKKKRFSVIQARNDSNIFPFFSDVSELFYFIWGQSYKISLVKNTHMVLNSLTACHLNLELNNQAVY
jgi:hypothetical protein